MEQDDCTIGSSLRGMVRRTNPPLETVPCRFWAVEVVCNTLPQRRAARTRDDESVLFHRFYLVLGFLCLFHPTRNCRILFIGT